ncbi:MAG: hypothetical protein ACE5F1_01875 [Planctomycetota bacterium]
MQKQPKSHSASRATGLLCLALPLGLMLGYDAPEDPVSRYTDAIGKWSVDIGEEWVIVRKANAKAFLDPLRERTRQVNPVSSEFIVNTTSALREHLRSKMTVLLVPHKAVSGDEFAYLVSVTTKKGICPSIEHLRDPDFLARCKSSMLAKLAPPGSDILAKSQGAVLRKVGGVDVAVLNERIENSAGQALASWILNIIPGGDRTYYLELFAHPDYKAEATLAVRNLLESFKGAQRKYSGLSMLYLLIMVSSIALVLVLALILLQMRRKSDDSPTIDLGHLKITKKKEEQTEEQDGSFHEQDHGQEALQSGSDRPL